MLFHRGKSSQKSSQSLFSPVSDSEPVSSQSPIESLSQSPIESPIESPLGTARDRPKKWHLKAMLMAISVGILPVAVLGGLGFLATSQLTAQAIAEQQKTQAESTSNLLKQFLNERHQDLQGLANLPILRPSNPVSPNPRLPVTNSLIVDQPLLEAAKQSYGVYDSLAVLDLQGNPIVQTGGTIWEPQTESAYFKAALTSKYPVMGATDVAGGFIPWAAPMHDAKTGRLMAVMVVRLSIATLAKHLSIRELDNHSELENEHVAVLDQAGDTIFSNHPNRSASLLKAWSNTLQQQSENFRVSPNLQWGLAIGRSKSQLKSEYAIGAATIPTIANQSINWQVIQSVNPQIVVATQRDRLWLLLFASLGLAALTASIAVFSARKAANFVEGEVTRLRQKEREYQQKQQRQTERSQWLCQIVESMRQSLREEDILNTTVTELRYALKTDRVIVYRFHDDWHGTIIAESVATGWKKILGETVRDPLREGLIERYRNGRVRTIDDIQTANLTRCHEDILAGFQIRASIVAPIRRNGELIGLLCAHHCAAPRQWEEEDIELFSQLASQLGFVLEKAALIQKQARSMERSRLLSEIVGNMRQSMVREIVLNTTVSELRYALKTDRVVIYRFNDDWNGEIIAESVAAGWRKLLGDRVEDPFREGLINRYRNGRVRSMNDIYTENLTECHQALLEGFQIRASIVAPVLQNGNLIGLLCAHQCGEARQWQSEEIDLFSQLAMQLGFALDHASMLEYTEQARQEARHDADGKAAEQQQAREQLQQRARELLQEVAPVSTGDLTVQARVTPDEVGTIATSYNTIIQSLRQIVTQVQTTSTSVAMTASNNEAAVTELSQEAKNQMCSLKEALKNVEMMIDAIEGIAKRARHAEASVQLATQTLVAGDAAMDRTVSGMSAIRETVAETANKVKRLGEASQKISRAISLINGFAAQTNMLALNAAIEASKAGEDSQGFGVVAEKVRSLAQQSTTATAEIEQLVGEIQTQTNEVVTAMEAGTDQVIMGTHLVEESRQHLSQISEAGHHINQLVKEIVQVTIAQTHTSRIVSQKMQQVASIADNTSQQTETVAESFKHLLKVADELQVSMSQFKVK
jgi:methyl-accepting chemotaxis protein PixJ